ncbi:MAG: GH116 family glycosyl hydrolase [Candidatus Omnitrophota bacterium]|nr:GH116 family glycosyl hydrolase [Candidatus Omnitrophota bacterium]
MPNYNSKQKLKSGVPLGGIGAGKIEILPNGTLDFFTIQNNLDKPLTDSQPKKEAEGVLGFLFGIQTRTAQGQTVSRLLQTVKVKGFETVEKIEYEGKFPRAQLSYQDKALPVKVVLEAVSFFIPQDENNSSLPQVTFNFKFTNNAPEEIHINFMSIARNIVGSWCVGRHNQVEEDDQFTRIDFLCANTLANDPAEGKLSLAIPKSPDYQISYQGEFNLQNKSFFFNKEHISLRAWDYLSKFYNLSNINTQKKVESESVQLAGALNVQMSLRPKETKEVLVYLAWYFPNGPEGHVYENKFSQAEEVIQLVHANHRFMIKKVISWQEEILNCGLPAWLSDALINNLYPLFSSSLWTKTDKFAMVEAPQACFLTGTLDVRFYSSIATALFFPRLELKELLLFARTQRENGYIPHDLGHKRLDMPSNGTTALFWKDLNPKFILMAYRNFLFTQNKGFLEEIYPVAKKALEWIMHTDNNDDYLPDNQGQDQTFDLWPFYGASSYTSSIFLASLLAMEKMAVLMQDNKTKDLAREWFEKGSENFQKKLWNGKYFICYNDKDKNESCTVAQLTGQWYAHLLNLGYIVDKEKVKKALGSIFKLNGKSSQLGAVNGILPNGKIDVTCWQSKNIWPGINYAFCALAIYEGFTKEALELAQKVHSNFTGKIMNPWNQPDMFDSKSGQSLFGDHYMRNMVIWAIPLALAKKNPKVQGLIDSLRNFT